MPRLAPKELKLEAKEREHLEKLIKSSYNRAANCLKGKNSASGR
jgi:hypothetical protein